MIDYVQAPDNLGRPAIWAVHTENGVELHRKRLGSFGTSRRPLLPGTVERRIARMLADSVRGPQWCPVCDPVPSARSTKRPKWRPGDAQVNAGWGRSQKKHGSIRVACIWR